MNQQEAFDKILRALEKAVPSSSKGVSLETHLIKDGTIDSLDLMAFLYELERDSGGRLEEIGEDFKDFRVIRLVEILRKA